MHLLQRKQDQKDMGIRFGAKIRAKRNELELSQDQLALLCPLHRNTISKVEKSANTPADVDPGILVLLARGLEMPVEELVGYSVGRPSVLPSVDGIDNEMAKTQSTVVELNEAAQAALAEAVGRLRLKKKDLLASVLEWFVQQDDELQRVIAGLIPASMASHAAKLLLERMAEGKEGQPFVGAVIPGGGVPVAKDVKPSAVK